MNKYGGKYDVGDIVKIKKDLISGKKYGIMELPFVEKMEVHKGKFFTIDRVLSFCEYTVKELRIDEHTSQCAFCDEMIECKFKNVVDIKNISGGQCNSKCLELIDFIEENNLTEEEVLNILKWHLNK